MITKTGYTGTHTNHPEQPYAQNYPKTAYYDHQATFPAQAYAGHGYSSEFYAPQQPPQQGYELSHRSAV